MGRRKLRGWYKLDNPRRSGHKRHQKKSGGRKKLAVGHTHTQKPASLPTQKQTLKNSLIQKKSLYGGWTSLSPSGTIRLSRLWGRGNAGGTKSFLLQTTFGMPPSPLRRDRSRGRADVGDNQWVPRANNGKLWTKSRWMGPGGGWHYARNQNPPHLCGISRHKKKKHYLNTKKR